jgi:hypothetical protein
MPDDPLGIVLWGSQIRWKEGQDCKSTGRFKDDDESARVCEGLKSKTRKGKITDRDQLWKRNEMSPRQVGRSAVLWKPA